MEDSRILLGKVNLSVRRNLGKAIVSLLLVFLSSIILAPLSLTLLAGGLLPLALVAMLLSPLILFMLQISFAQMCARMYRGDPCVLGNLLDSFRDWRRCSVLALVYAVGAVVVCAGVVYGGQLLALGGTGFDSANFDDEAVLSMLFSFFPALAMLCMVVFFLLVLLPTSFAHLVLMDNGGLPFLAAVQENFRLLRGRKVQLLKFLLRAGGIWLVGAVVFLVGNFTIVSAMFQQPESALDSLRVLSLASQACEMVYFVCVYTSLIRLVTAVAVFYQAVKDEEGGREPSLQIPSNEGSAQD